LFGLTIEAAVLSLPAAAYLLYCEASGTGMFLHAPPLESLLMAGGGLVTAVPLLLFASATTRVPLTTIGVLQYLTPTMQFLIGVFIYNELFPFAKLIGFGLVWAALLFFWTEGIIAGRRRGASMAGLP
jgi:chloramphenicol-sensitive protein RarD